MSKPIIITCQPDDQYFIWQNHAYIESCLEQGFEQEQIHILLYKPTFRKYNTNWEKLKTCYPKINIFLYEDKGVEQQLRVYIPILRPHILWQHFEAHPELKEKTIIYTDCDILWLNGLDIEKFYDDKVCYVSDARSYLNHSYFESKKKDILPEKKEQSENRDFLGEICNIVGIDKKVAVENNDNTGGVQYILKNVDAPFWKKVEQDTLKIRRHLLQVNKEFFKNENAGIQSWCADLWAVQFNLWYRNQETRVVKELDFAWATDPISKLERVSIFHNAGIVNDTANGYPAFYKGKYHTGQDPFKDPHLKTVLENEESKKHCTHFYVTKLLEIKQKYNLNY